jgi:uncharacterized membrane protein
MAIQGMIETESRSGADSRDTRLERHGARRGIPEKMADALGWFSLGLGLTEIVAPRALAKFIGVPRRPMMMRLMGLREVVTGVGILTTRRPEGWLWARLGGDMIEMAALAGASTSRRAKGKRLTAAMGAVAGVTVLDAICAQQLSARRRGKFWDSVRFTASVLINRSPEECYQYWHDIEKLPTFLDHLKSVRITGEGRSHWVAKGPGGKDISWDAEITEDIPNELIAWRSLGGGDIVTSGRVRFEAAPGNRGTIVRVLMDYQLPARLGGVPVTKLLGRDPGHRVRKDLLRFKQLLETGEIATTEGQPAGRRSGATWLDRTVRI